MVRRQDVPGFGWQRAVAGDGAWAGWLARAAVVLVVAPALAALAVAVWPLLGTVLVLAYWAMLTTVTALIAWPAARRAWPWLGPALRRAAGWTGVGLARAVAAGRRHWQAVGPRRRPSLTVAARIGVGASAYRVRDHGQHHGQDHDQAPDEGLWATGEEWAA